MLPRTRKAAQSYDFFPIPPNISMFFLKTNDLTCKVKLDASHLPDLACCRAISIGNRELKIIVVCVNDGVAVGVDCHMRLCRDEDLIADASRCRIPGHIVSCCLSPCALFYQFSCFCICRHAPRLSQDVRCGIKVHISADVRADTVVIALPACLIKLYC